MEMKSCLKLLVPWGNGYLPCSQKTVILRKNQGTGSALELMISKCSYLNLVSEGSHVSLQ